jgi:hypothetical protein
MISFLQSIGAAAALPEITLAILAMVLLMEFTRHQLGYSLGCGCGIHRGGSHGDLENWRGQGLRI